eukprot:CAMPEP_0177257190 /NCGR_PEP_ID=MMETSP0367-20130122/57390_1 /TAXON_ID=447022 ORGANISM="Scrippsiella hangoei-like, Strain SHHI-4" /NCGR_SAMPLE_ID=MMETSP0367 /ASSEMBLY_ACC=CAM_ASM_000362 /LENGTH=432 /DNA_ID=CAMNT_0018711219 /DNA_START=57 /DNA_END=1355 /DNA_ORIENTATION=+
MSTPTFANSAAAFAAADRRPPTSASRPVKLFIGGLTRNTTTKLLRDHFSQYGRILDCVAMVQPDGRPRGFGYVTLDSAAAADRCLGEPQVVDGRVVDMKRAVPGSPVAQCGGGGGGFQHGAAGAAGNGGDARGLLGVRGQRRERRDAGVQGQGRSPSHAYGASPSPFFPAGAWEAASVPCSPTEAQIMAAQIMAAQAALAAQASAAWAAAWAAASPKAAAEFDCLNLMRRGASGCTTASVCESLNLLTGDASGRHCAFGSFCAPSPMSSAAARRASTAAAATPSGASKGFGALSCETPEFVPGSAARAVNSSTQEDEDDTPEKLALPAKPSTRRRTILGDITNLSPMKVMLPAAIKSGSFSCASTSFEEPGSFRLRRPASAFDIFEDERQGAGEAESNKENATPLGFSFPPGLEPPQRARATSFAATPLLLR